MPPLPEFHTLVTDSCDSSWMCFETQHGILTQRLPLVDQLAPSLHFWNLGARATQQVSRRPVEEEVVPEAAMKFLALPVTARRDGQGLQAQQAYVRTSSLWPVWPRENERSHKQRPAPSILHLQPCSSDVPFRCRPRNGWINFFSHNLGISYVIVYTHVRSHF